MEEGHFMRNHKGPGRTPTDGGVCDWAERQADFLSALHKRLMGDLSADGLRRSFVDWTDVPYAPAGLGIALGDCYVGSGAISMEKSPENNAYVQLNYHLMLPDPVMQAAGDRLVKFLSSCFYANRGPFQLYLAAEALAAHHETVKATIFLKDEGGKGKSALSALRATVREDAHAFADPSIFFFRGGVAQAGGRSLPRNLRDSPGDGRRQVGVLSGAAIGGISHAGKGGHTP